MAQRPTGRRRLGSVGEGRMSWEVHKFGGASVKDAAGVQNVARLVADMVAEGRDDGQSAARVISREGFQSRTVQPFPEQPPRAPEPRLRNSRPHGGRGGQVAAVPVAIAALVSGNRRNGPATIQEPSSALEDSDRSRSPEHVCTIDAQSPQATHGDARHAPTSSQPDNKSAQPATAQIPMPNALQ